MIDKLTPLFTGAHKILSPLHHYDVNTSNEDVVVIVSEPYESIYYIVVDNKYSTVLLRKPLNCTNRIKKAVIGMFPKILPDELSIDSVFGVYSYVNKVPQTCIFIVLIRKHTTRKFLVQVDIINNDISDLRITGIEKYSNNYYMYFDTLVTLNVIVNDYTTTKNTDVYITYLPMDVTKNPASLNIEGVQVLMNDDDKYDFTLRTNVELPQHKYPIVDTWSDNNRKFFKLTEDTTHIKMNFSTGVGFIGFKE